MLTDTLWAQKLAMAAPDAPLHLLCGGTAGSSRGMNARLGVMVPLGGQLWILLSQSPSFRQVYSLDRASALRKAGSYT